MSTQISRNSLNNTISLVYFRNIYMDNQHLKSHNKLLGTNLPKLILRPSYFVATSLPISTRLILSVSSLWIDKIDRLPNRLVIIVQRSHVLILWATEKDLLGVQEVAGFISIRCIMVTSFGISARLVKCKDSRCSSISEKFVQLLPWNIADIEQASVWSCMESISSLYTLNTYPSSSS